MAVMLNTVVSVGRTRLFAGMGLGAGKLVRLVIEVGVVDERLIRPASPSVPVFTDQRSTPHCVAAVGALELGVGVGVEGPAGAKRFREKPPCWLQTPVLPPDRLNVESTHCTT
jgi:hypothetical protein